MHRHPRLGILRLPLISGRVLRVIVVLALFTAPTIVGLSAAPALAANGYPNAANANTALARLGQNGGQCKQFVNDVTLSASGGLVHLGGGYYSDYQRELGDLIATSDAAVTGDVIQLNKATDRDTYYIGMHTAIVVANGGGGNFTVVDSNWNGDGIVKQHTWNPYTYAAGYGFEVNIWRLGTVSNAPTGVGTRLLADVDGDVQHKADAVVMFRDSGTAMVALSTGSSFASPSAWTAEPQMANATRYFLGDVNGDGKADLIGFWNSGGVWKAMLSNGTAFTGPPATWASGQGVGTSKQWIADVDGDAQHNADMVTFDAATGDWWVSTSTGTGFGPTQSRWRQGHGIGSTDQFVADFTGDGKADAGVYVASNGNWYVGSSTGSSFGYPNQWSAGHGMNSSQRLVGQVSYDGMADAAYFFAANGHWDVGTSSGSGFWSPTAWAHGQGVGTTERFLADVSGDGWYDMITFDVTTGDWWVSTSSGSGLWPPQRWISGHGTNS